MDITTEYSNTLHKKEPKGPLILKEIKKSAENNAVRLFISFVYELNIYFFMETIFRKSIK
jgi:hypothetical protein